jgi:glycosyltransferase involved in cell wall biosynthesis
LKVVFKPFQLREKLMYSLTVPDAHLVTLQPAMEGLIVPSKFYGIMAAGRPTIFVGDPNGEIPEILRSADCGFTVAKGDVAGLVKAIMDLKQNPGLAERFGFNARRLFERRYKKSMAMNSFEKLFRKVDQQNSPKIDGCRRFQATVRSNKKKPESWSRSYPPQGRIASSRGRHPSANAI